MCKQFRARCYLHLWWHFLGGMVVFKIFVSQNRSNVLMHFKSCRKLWKLWRVEEDSRQRKKHNDRKNTKNSFNLKLIQIINTKNSKVTKTRWFIQLKNSTRYFQTSVCSSCHTCMWGEIVKTVQEYQICTSYDIREGGWWSSQGRSYQ